MNPPAVSISVSLAQRGLVMQWRCVAARMLKLALPIVPLFQGMACCLRQGCAVRQTALAVFASNPYHVVHHSQNRQQDHLKHTQ